MARSRNIKPSLFENELLGEADPMLSLLFAGLWCLADREGRLEDRPVRIKAKLFPYRNNVDLPLFNGYLTELERLGFIERYVVENLAIIQVVNFAKHQKPHNTEKRSDLPAKPANTGITVKEPLNNGYVTVDLALIPDSLNTDSLSKPPDKSDGEYEFAGETIKLNCRDFEKLKTQYPNVDLADQLRQLDLELRGKKNWFVEMNSKLNYRNRTPAHQKPKQRGGAAI